MPVIAGQCYTFGCIGENIMTRNKQPSKTTKAQLVRSVASSSAIETGKTVQAIEAKLKAKKSKYTHLQLAL